MLMSCLKGPDSFYFSLFISIYLLFIIYIIYYIVLLYITLFMSVSIIHLLLPNTYHQRFPPQTAQTQIAVIGFCHSPVDFHSHSHTC